MSKKRDIDTLLCEVFCFERVVADSGAGGASAIESKVKEAEEKEQTGDGKLGDSKSLSPMKGKIYRGDKNKRAEDGEAEDSKSLSGTMAKIRRGDAGMTIKRRRQLAGSHVALSYLNHPLFEILRNPQLATQELRRIWWRISPALRIPLITPTVLCGQAQFMRIELTTDVCDILCKQADHYSLTALLLIVIEAPRVGCAELGFYAARRAAQCLAFASTGELQVIWTPLVARVRQRILDNVRFNGKRLALEAFDFSRIHEKLSFDIAMMRPKPLEVETLLCGKNSSGTKYMSNAPGIVAGRRPYALPSGLPPIAMRSRIFSRGGPIVRFGSEALKILEEGLDEYWPGVEPR